MNIPNVQEHIKQLLNQVPIGYCTTPEAVALALGDINIVTVVNNFVINNNLSHFFNPSQKLFNYFQGEKPLKQLQDHQRTLSIQVLEKDLLAEYNQICGVDVSYNDEWGYVSCVVTDSNNNILIRHSEKVKTTFPYIPGYLMYREAPPIFKALKKIDFDLLMVNGHGIAHPRGCGLAAYVGVTLNSPTIGVAKSKLYGSVCVGDKWSPIISNCRIIGKRLKRNGHAPIFISVGQLISLNSACTLVEKYLSKGRFPEPLRLAHLEAKNFMNNNLKQKP